MGSFRGYGRASSVRGLGAPAVLTAVATSVWLLVGSAIGDDHRRPRSVLTTSQAHQKGRIISMSWARRVSVEECVISDGTNSLTFPKAIRSRPGEVVSIRLRKNEMPVEFSIEAWHSVRRDGTPRGSAKSMPAVLSPRRREGRVVAWTVNVPLRDRPGHTFMHVTAYWTDETGCHPPPDLGSQFASWSFHVRSPRQSSRQE